MSKTSAQRPQLDTDHVSPAARALHATGPLEKPSMVTDAFRFRALLDNSHEGMAVLGKDNKLTYANPAALHILGYDLSALQTLDLRQLTHPDDRELVHNQFAGLVKANASVTAAYRVLCNAKGYRWIEVTAKNMLADPAIQGIVVSYRDVNEQYETQAALQAGEARFRLVLQNASDITTLFEADGTIIYQSPSIRRILGRPNTDRVGRSIFESSLVHSADRVRKQCFLKALVRARHGTEHSGEFRMLHADGSWRTLEVIGINLLDEPAIKAILLSSRDISERKKAELDLRESQSRWQFMAAAMPQKIFTVTTDDQLDYFNPQWVKYTGFTPPELKDYTTWQKIVHPEDAAESNQRWQQSLKTGTPFEHECRLRRHDGIYRWHITRIQPMRDSDGNIHLWVGSNTDVEDFKLTAARAEELEKLITTLREERRKLEGLNKSKDEFIALASHQLRTPATGVKQYIGLVLGEYAGTVPEQQRELLEQANNSNERQISIVSELLRVSQIDLNKVSLSKQRTNLTELLRDIADEHRAVLHDHRQTLQFGAPKTAIYASVDSDNLRMAISNLLDNAIKYSPDGAAVSLSLHSARNAVRIRVSDEGVGIAKADMPKLFQKFSRVSNPLSVVAGGSGLGLYWAKKVIDLHKGSITVTSVAGKGTTFTITLPGR